MNGETASGRFTPKSSDIGKPDSFVPGLGHAPVAGWYNLRIWEKPLVTITAGLVS
jgi:hypothetical protein